MNGGWDRYYRGFLLTRRRGAYDLSVLDRLSRARDAAQAHPERVIGLDEMANAACFSKFHFLRLFREAYGETPLRYLTKVRLERARSFLESTDRSVTDISFEVGYESPASFSAAFRRHAGVPPERYRRRFVAVPRALGPVARVPGCFVAMYS